MSEDEAINGIVGFIAGFAVGGILFAFVFESKTREIMTEHFNAQVCVVRCGGSSTAAYDPNAKIFKCFCEGK